MSPTAPRDEVLGGGWYFATETARITGGLAVTPEAAAPSCSRSAAAERCAAMSWQATSLVILALVIVGGFAWFERSRPSARIVAAVAALAALGVAGRVVLAPIPNVVATTDVALLAGYTLGGGPGFAVGALSGLVSNFWLGQGPWTPWQMAGWGLVGIARRRARGDRRQAPGSLGAGRRRRPLRARLRRPAGPLGDGHLRGRAVAGPVSGACPLVEYPSMSLMRPGTPL